MNVHKVSAMIGDRELSIEIGKLAKQANGSALVRYGDTVVLVTACAADPREGLDFFPLTVDYRENFYAAGKIPGGFFKREGLRRTSLHAPFRGPHARSQATVVQHGDLRKSREAVCSPTSAQGAATLDWTII